MILKNILFSRKRKSYLVNVEKKVSPARPGSRTSKPEASNTFMRYSSTQVPAASNIEDATQLSQNLRGITSFSDLFHFAVLDPAFGCKIDGHG